jgi:hypothetical protein
MKTYEELAAKALRPVTTLTQAEAVIKRDFTLKLPARTYVQLWNTPEINQFRGVQESLDEEAKQREDAEQERVEIRRAGREAGASTVDVNLLHTRSSSNVSPRKPWRRTLKLWIRLIRHP